MTTSAVFGHVQRPGALLKINVRPFGIQQFRLPRACKQQQTDNMLELPIWRKLATQPKSVRLVSGEVAFPSIVELDTRHLLHRIAVKQLPLSGQLEAA